MFGPPDWKILERSGASGHYFPAGVGRPVHSETGSGIDEHLFLQFWSAGSVFLSGGIASGWKQSGGHPGADV